METKKERAQHEPHPEIVELRSDKPKLREDVLPPIGLKDIVRDPDLPPI